MPRLIMVNDVLPSDVTRLVNLLAELEVCSSVKVVPVRSFDMDLSTEAERAQIQFKVVPANLNSVVKALNSSNFRIFDVIDVVTSTEAIPKVKRRIRPGLRGYFPSSIDRLSTLEIHKRILDSSHFTYDHVMMVVIASGLACVGLLTDSLVNILAAFYVSPLMNMIMCATWGLVIKDRKLYHRGLRNVVFGGVVAVAIGFMVGLLLNTARQDAEGLQHFSRGGGIYTFISINSEQIQSRGPPADINLMTTACIAMLSGITIAMGQSTGISNALSGVTLAASLLPPLNNCGIMLALSWKYPEIKTERGYTLREVAFVSLCIYLVTVPVVMMTAFLTFKFKHVGGLSLLGTNADTSEELDRLTSEFEPDPISLFRTKERTSSIELPRARSVTR